VSTVQHVLNRVRRDLHDEDSGAYRWSDAELIDYVNDAIAEIIRLKPEAGIVEELFTPPDDSVLQKLPARSVKFIKAICNEDSGGGGAPT
jgi:hypothetical protein